MVTNVHAVVLAITSIETQIWVDPSIPMSRWCPDAVVTQKIEVAARGVSSLAGSEMKCILMPWFFIV